MPSIRFVSPPAKNSSGVGKYSKNVANALAEEATVHRQHYPAESNRLLAFAKHAIAAGSGDEDLVHVQFDYVQFGSFTLMSWVFFPLLFLSTRASGNSVVITIHEVITPELIRGRLSTLKSVYITLLNRLLALVADHIIFLSKQSERRFTGSVPVAEYSRVPHGVPKVSLDRDQADAKTAFGYGPDDTVVIEPGYVSPRKGSDRFKRIAKRTPEYEFLLAGGSPREKYNEFVEQLRSDLPSNLKLTGRLDDKWFDSAFAAADVAVLPYQELYQNGIKNTVAQSGILNLCIAHELPIIATDCAYFTDLEAEWDCVRTFGSADEACLLLDELVENPSVREEFVQNMREFKRYNNMSNVVSSHIDVYQVVRDI